jgi:hypothetical protein
MLTLSLLVVTKSATMPWTQVEVEATRREVDYMVELFKSEIESASRIAAGGLKLLQLQKTIGQSAIDQLTHFGTQTIFIHIHLQVFWTEWSMLENLGMLGLWEIWGCGKTGYGCRKTGHVGVVEKSGHVGIVEKLGMLGLYA